jgi:hypothetical protein
LFADETMCRLGEEGLAHQPLQHRISCGEALGERDREVVAVDLHPPLGAETRRRDVRAEPRSRTGKDGRGKAFLQLTQPGHRRLPD